MCTVICRWAPDAEVPVQMLALRDEFAGRDFDDPDRWWPGAGQVIGGRDRAAGGTWCASDVTTGATAAVLNRPPREAAVLNRPPREAAVSNRLAGLSRGVLPLLALEHGDRWVDFIDVDAMAGFNLLLATADSLTWWRHETLSAEIMSTALEPGTHLFRPLGLVPGPIDPTLAAARLNPGRDGSLTQRWGDWFTVLERSPATDAADALIKAPRGPRRYQTVFAQFVAGAPDELRLDFQRLPRPGGSWTTRSWIEAREASSAD